MVEEKKEETRIKKAENISSIVFYLKSKESKFIFLILIFLGFLDIFSTAIGIILFTILFLPVLMVKRKLFSNQLIALLFFIVSVVFIGYFFLRPDKSFSNITFSVVMVSTIISLPFVFTKMASSTRDAERNKEKNPDVGKLIGLCLKSENFNFRLILAFWLFFFAIAFQKTLIISGELSGDLPLGGLVIILVYITVFFTSFSLIFNGMISSTKNIDKSFFVTLQFSLILIIILSIICLPVMFLAPAYLTPSFGV